MPEEWKNELTPLLVPEGLCRQIADNIGAENLLRLAALIGGSTVYIPKQREILRKLRDQKILEEFNGYNYLELVQKYEVSERWVREITSR